MNQRSETVVKGVFLAFLVFLLVGAPLVVSAETADSYALSIQKYKLDASTSLPKEFLQDGTKVEHAVDADGKKLVALPGIQYEVTRVTPISGGTDYQLVEGAAAFSTTIVTDQTGLARIDGLAQGMYRVIEKNNGQLKNVMEPVILELPLPQAGDKPALSEVYLYPKSSVVSSKAPTEKPKTVERLPQTSGNIGNYRPFIPLSLVILIMGSLGFLSMCQRNTRN
ncbi:hypothetical protein IGI37_001378 [Enterococcus sp. AZ194]|uniref:pilin N-terminal domain-containing protein n=1 Tax=Enterococcus sp. AZ194 TaxID=2774629 RepID=UPI003F284D54